MRRVAMMLGAVGVVALGLAGSPAQAYDGGWEQPGDYHGSRYLEPRAAAWRAQEAREWAWRRHEWREHHHLRPWYNHFYR